MDRRTALKQASLIGGIALSPALISSLITGCTTEKKLDWTPEFFTNEEAINISGIVDSLLPASGTPGALDAGIDQFVDLIFSTCKSADDQLIIKNGMAELKNILTENQAGSFLELDASGKDKVMTQLEEMQEGDANYYRIIKTITLFGFFRSEIAMKSLLEYKPVPGKFEAYVTISENDKLWVGGRV